MLTLITSQCDPNSRCDKLAPPGAVRVVGNRLVTNIQTNRRSAPLHKAPFCGSLVIKTNIVVFL